MLFRDLTFLKLHDKILAMDIQLLGRKRQTIARALVSYGIPVFNGLPDHIMNSLKKEGYVIKKKKKNGKN
jgi:hypothetical protein